MAGVTDEPGIAIILGCAGLAGRRVPGQRGLARRAGRQRLLHHLVHHRGVALIDDPAEPRIARLVEELSARAAHLVDDMRRDRDAAIRERHIRRDELHHGHFGSTERDRGIRLELRRDAEAMRGAHHRLWGDLQRQAHRHGIERECERLGQRDRAEIFVGVVLRLPPLDVDRLVLAHGVGGEPALQRGQIDERLERRARLALRRNRAVELALRIVLAADQRAHRTLRRHRDQRALLDVELRTLREELIEQRLLGRRLQGWIDGGLDHDVLLDAPDHVVEHVHHPVGDVIDRAARGLLDDLGRQRKRGLDRARGDVAGVRHRGEHDLRAPLRAIEVARRRKLRGRLDEPGEQRGF